MGYFSLNDRKRKNELLGRMSPWLCLLSFQLSVLVQLQEQKIRISRILLQLFACLIMTENKQATKLPMSLALAEVAPAAWSEECTQCPCLCHTCLRRGMNLEGSGFSLCSPGEAGLWAVCLYLCIPSPSMKFHNSLILKSVLFLNVAYRVICLQIIWMLPRYWNTLLSKYLATANSSSRHH